MSAPTGSLPIAEMAAAIATESPTRTPTDAAPMRRRGEPWRRQSWADLAESERYYQKRFYQERDKAQLNNARAESLLEEIHRQRNLNDQLLIQVKRGQNLRRYLRNQIRAEKAIINQAIENAFYELDKWWQDRSVGEITQDGEYTAKQKLVDLQNVVNGFAENISSDEE